MSTEELPSWFPQLADADWAQRMRNDYPEHNMDNLSTEEVRYEMNDGCKYQILWDHVGDAYKDYEQLADAYLALLTQTKDNS